MNCGKSPLAAVLCVLTLTGCSWMPFAQPLVRPIPPVCVRPNPPSVSLFLVGDEEEERDLFDARLLNRIKLCYDLRDACRSDLQFVP